MQCKWIESEMKMNQSENQHELNPLFDADLMCYVGQAAENWFHLLNWFSEDQRKELWVCEKFRSGAVESWQWISISPS